jgi:tetratricopeptide (TPR) repeat protein
MAVKRYWPRINLRWVNILLCGLIGLCVVGWGAELRWAAREFPLFLQGRIGSPVERRLYLRAKQLIERGEDLETARSLLLRSIAIDPTSNAVYWMGEYYLATGDEGQALQEFERYLEFDPTRVEAYLQVSRILEGQARWVEAHAILERGLQFFSIRRGLLTPRPDPEAAMKFNEKALGRYRYCGESIDRLTGALRRVESRSRAVRAGS